MRYLYLSLVGLFLHMCLAACSTDKLDEVAVEGDEVNMTIVADQNRTHLNSDGTHIEWDATGEYLMVYQTADNTTISAKSSEAVVNGGLAQFGVTFQGNAAAQSFVYNAIYPAASVSVDATPAVDDVLFTLPLVQNPTALSYDNSADLLVARSVSVATQPEALSMSFKRLVALGRLSLTGIDDVAIKSIELRVPGANLAGSIAVNLTDGCVAEYSNTSDCITIVYDELVATTTPIFFTALPATIEAGDSFSVSVQCSNGDVVSREVRLPAGRSLNFTAGNMTIFKVNMDNKGSEDVDFGTIAGEWRLMEWCGMDKSEFDFDIYLDISASGSVTLWQRLAQLGWEKFESNASILNGVISGTYSDGVKWSGDYNVTMDNGRMIWTNTLDATDVSVYERTDIPDEVSECGTIASKFVLPIL